MFLCVFGSLPGVASTAWRHSMWHIFDDISLVKDLYGDRGPGLYQDEGDNDGFMA